MERVLVLAKIPRRSIFLPAALIVALTVPLGWQIAIRWSGADELRRLPNSAFVRLPGTASAPPTASAFPAGWLTRLPKSESHEPANQPSAMPLAQSQRLPAVLVRLPMAADTTSPSSGHPIDQNEIQQDSLTPPTSTGPAIIAPSQAPISLAPPQFEPVVQEPQPDGAEQQAPELVAPGPAAGPTASNSLLPAHIPVAKADNGSSVPAAPHLGHFPLAPAQSSPSPETTQPLVTTADTAPDRRSVDALPVAMQRSPSQPPEHLPVPVAENAETRVPWWQTQISQPIGVGTTARDVDLNSLVMSALSNSPRVKAIRDQPLVRETSILEASAEFDPKSFLESKYVSLSDPVGNTLTTGGPPRFRQQDYQLSAGVRKKSTLGGTLEFSQKLGKLHSNSLFFVPPQQGNARLSLNLTQPMLRGGGQAYNTSLIVIAELDTSVAADQASAQIQDHLLEVARAYATLRLQRAALLQKRRLSERAEHVLTELEARERLDANASQIARTRAAVAVRRALLVRAGTDVLNAETRIQVLVQDPSLIGTSRLEMIPQITIDTETINVALSDAYVTALNNRPEVDEALRRVQAAEKRVGMAANEVLPTLDLMLETYLAGLAPNYQTGNAFGDQFTEGQPGFTAGFLFESPWGNRADRAKLQRRQIETRQAANQFQEALASLRGEVEIAVREVETAQREIEGNWQAMQAAEVDIRLMEERWRLLPGDDGTRSYLLEDLLRAHERLAGTEYDFARAQYRYSVSLAELKRVTGVLLRREDLVGPQWDTSVPPVTSLDSPNGPVTTTDVSVDEKVAGSDSAERSPALPSASATPAPIGLHE